MPIPNLGTLEEMELREVWDHEAQSFTPWLAQHLDSLAEVIGLPLELEGQEVAVESFWADILARDPRDESLVLIENQLETADHNHLGQIMTYLAGLEANTVIWIARDFRDAHLSAVRWLNEHTEGGFAFFAIKVRVVRIGDSAPAPVFEVLVKPNQWERQLHAAAQEAQSLTGVGEFRKSFWENYLRLHPDEIRDGGAGGYSNRWRTVDPPGMVVSSYLSRNGVGLFIRGRRGADPLKVYEALLPYQEQLSAITGGELGGPETPYHFGLEYQADTADESQWDELANWLYEMTGRYERALQAIDESAVGTSEER